MTKLIEHYYNISKGVFITFEIEVKETAKQFSRLGRIIQGEYWLVLPKSQLDELRVTHNTYHLYSRKENMPHFQNLVIADLERIAVAKSLELDKSQENYWRAHNAAE